MIINTEHQEIETTLDVDNPPPQWYDNIPSDATLQSEHFDFDRGIRYPALSYEQKKQTYSCGIAFVLFQIENNESIPKKIRDNAYYARIGASILIHVKLGGIKLNNTIFLPAHGSDGPGILIRLNSNIPYYYFSKWGDLAKDLKSDYKEKSRVRRFTTFLQTRSLAEKANFYNSKPMDMVRLSKTLVDAIENDDELKRDTTNNILISRAIAGAHIPDPGVSANDVKYKLEFTFSDLRFSEYLQSFSRPFSIFGREMQLISSSIKGETIRETELHVHQAEYIGNWVDATVGLISSFTPAGWVFNTAQSVTNIAADLVDGKDPDPLAVAGLLVGCIPGGRIAAKVGKFTRIGGRVVKYGVMLGNKVVDLAIVGRSIKIAVDTGEPLAIYQALIASGMSINNSYDMTRNMSLSLKLEKKIEESASLKNLEALQNNATEYYIPDLVERKFIIGSKEMVGRINNGEVEILNEHAHTWERGSKLHLLSYRIKTADFLQKAGQFFKKRLSKEQLERLQTFTEAVDIQGYKWPPEPIDKKIHMIWIGTKNISEKNIALSINTAKKNPDYNTTIIYDSGILGYEGAKSFMFEKFNGSNVILVDFRDKGYFHQLQNEPAFSYYEQTISDKKYAQASDILRLLVLKYEGGVYKDIDDVQVKGFGDLAFPKGIGVMREYAPESGKSTAIPNTPIAATKNNSVVNRALEFAVDNYRRGEANILKLAGPDVFTEAVYQEIPGMSPHVLAKQLDLLELAKRQALGMPLEKPKSPSDEQLTLHEISIISRPYEEIRGLSGYVQNGADHSWASDIPDTSTICKGASEHPLVLRRSGLLPASYPSPELNPLRGYQDIKLGRKSAGIYPVLKSNGERLVTDQRPQLEVSYGPIDGQWDYLATTGKNFYRVSPDHDGRLVLRDSLLKTNNDGIIEFSSVSLVGGQPTKGTGSSIDTDPQPSTSSGSQSIQEPINVIDERITDHLSSDDELDFIWVTQVDITALTPVPEHYSPTEGSSILFMHSNGTELLLKKRPYPTQRVATQIKRLDGYNVREQEPLVLAACYAGDGGHRSIAQAFADALQRPVVASSGTIHITTNDEKSTLVSAYSPLPFTTFHPIPLYRT